MSYLKNRSSRRELFQWAKAFIIAISLVTVLRIFVFNPVIVDGASMNPTLNNGDCMIVNKIGDVQRFDIIVFHATEDSDYIKRVIGLPGDKIEYKNDKLYINGKHYKEPYLAANTQEELGPVTGSFTLKDITGVERVPEGEVFVLGDNRRNSTDSRHIGTIKMKDIVGKANLVFWPASDMGLVNK